MKELDTMTVTKAGQSTLPKWWRHASGLSGGGFVEVRSVHDGRNSLLLTPKPAQRSGASGKEFLEQFARCPFPLLAPARHPLPFK